MKIRTELHDDLKTELTDFILNELKSYSILLKLQGYVNACYTFTFSNDKHNHKIIKFHLYKDIGMKIITIYYNSFTKNISYRHELKYNDKLYTHSNKIEISKDGIHDVLTKIIMLY